MNEYKGNFLLKKSEKEVFDKLTNEDAGRLIKGVFDYVTTGKSNLEGYLQIIFIPIKNDIDENENSYIKRCETNKVNGSRGGAPKGNQNAKKRETTENNQSVEKTTENNMKNHISYITNHKSLESKKGVIGGKEETFKKVIAHLNEVTGSSFKYTTKSTQQKINARLNEGYKLDDFIVVIDKKWMEWKETEFEKYMCPETLFGTKFEKYLNQNVSQNQGKRYEGKQIVPDWLEKEEEKKDFDDERRKKSKLLEMALTNHENLVLEFEGMKLKLVWDDEISNYRGYSPKTDLVIGTWYIEFLLEILEEKIPNAKLEIYK